MILWLAVVSDRTQKREAGTLGGNEWVEDSQEHLLEEDKQEMQRMGTVITAPCQECWGTHIVHAGLSFQSTGVRNHYG